MLTLNNWSVRLKSSSETILKKVCMSLESGKRYVVYGDNGSGKSTLLKSIAGVDDFFCTGDIIWNSKNIISMTPDERSNAGIFLSFQNPLKIENLSLYDLCQLISSKRNKNWKVELENLLSIFKLPLEYSKKGFNAYNSGGEKKINEIIQCLLLKPRLCLLDEIEAGLDESRYRLFNDQLLDLQKNGSIILLSTHQKSLWHSYDKNFILEGGKLLECTT